MSKFLFLIKLLGSQGEDLKISANTLKPHSSNKTLTFNLINHLNNHFDYRFIYLFIHLFIYLFTDLKASNFIKKRLRYRCFPVIYENFKNTYFEEHLRRTASKNSNEA